MEAQHRRMKAAIELTGLAAILALYALWSACYIWHTSFLIDGQRYFCLFDDGMISMRYALNLAQGSGLVWNSGGDHVEGYTNPLWTLIMAGVHFVGMPPRLASLAIQLLGLALLLANAVCVYRIAKTLCPSSGTCGLAAAFLTAFYLPINTWGLQGMEVSLLVFLVSLSVLLLLRDSPRGLFFRLPFLLLALGILTRPDMVVPFLVVTLWVALYHPNVRRRALQFAGGVLLLTVIAVTTARWYYYREYLPNTYYLKMTGVPIFLRVLRGAIVFRDFVGAMGLILFSLPLFFAAVNIRNRGVALLAGMLAGQIMYSIYVGGDAWEWYGNYANRYICIAMQCFFVLLILALNVIVPTSGDPAAAGPRNWGRSAALLSFTGICWLAVHGAIPGWKMTDFARTLTFRRLPLHVANNAKHTIAGLWLKEVCPADSLLAAHWAGSTPYFSQLATVDLLGKSDKYIARMSTGATTWRNVYPGHDKYDHAYSLGILDPDVVVTPWPSDILTWGYTVVDVMEDVNILARTGSPLAEKLMAQRRKASDLHAPLAKLWSRTRQPNQVPDRARMRLSNGCPDGTN